MTVQDLALEMRARVEKCRAKSLPKIALKVEEMEVLLDALPRGEDDPVGRKIRESLTTRERKIVCMVARGMANREIADGLQMSLAYTKNCIRRIFDKTGMGSRLELLAFVHAHPEMLHPADKDLSSGAPVIARLQ